MTKVRFLSLVVTIGYMAAAFFGGGSEFVWRAPIFLILPMASFWFGDKMGSYTGIGVGRDAHYLHFFRLARSGERVILGTDAGNPCLVLTSTQRSTL